MVFTIVNGNAKKFAQQVNQLTGALKAAQAETVSIPEDVQALGRPQTGPEAATTQPQQTPAQTESTAASGSTRRRRTPTAG